MRMQSIIGLVALLMLAAAPVPALADKSTSAGQISVAQVVDVLNGAESDERSRQILSAYLAGLGEAAGLLIGNTKSYGASLSCARPLLLDVKSVSAALSKSAGSQETWVETPATPIIIGDLMERAGCK